MPCSEYECPLNGCRARVDDPRVPCDGCLALAGDLIQQSSGPGVSVEAFLEDSDRKAARVREVITERWMTDYERALRSVIAEFDAFREGRRSLAAPRPVRPRKPKFSDAELAEEAMHLVWCGTDRGEAARRLGVSRARLDEAIRQASAARKSAA